MSFPQFVPGFIPGFGQVFVPVLQPFQPVLQQQPQQPHVISIKKEEGQPFLVEVTGLLEEGNNSNAKDAIFSQIYADCWAMLDEPTQDSIGRALNELGNFLEEKGNEAGVAFSEKEAKCALNGELPVFALEILFEIMDKMKPLWDNRIIITSGNKYQMLYMFKTLSGLVKEWKFKNAKVRKAMNSLLSKFSGYSKLCMHKLDPSKVKKGRRFEFLPNAIREPRTGDKYIIPDEYFGSGEKFIHAAQSEIDAANRMRLLRDEEAARVKHLRYLILADITEALRSRMDDPSQGFKFDMFVKNLKGNYNVKDSHLIKEIHQSCIRKDVHDIICRAAIYAILKDPYFHCGSNLTLGVIMEYSGFSEKSVTEFLNASPSLDLQMGNVSFILSEIVKDPQFALGNFLDAMIIRQVKMEDIVCFQKCPPELANYLTYAEKEGWWCDYRSGKSHTSGSGEKFYHYLHSVANKIQKIVRGTISRGWPKKAHTTDCDWGDYVTDSDSDSDSDEEDSPSIPPYPGKSPVNVGSETPVRFVTTKLTYAAIAARV